jgi:phosphomannomutase
VAAEGADLGIAFDGDGDRVAFVDERGGAMSCDEALILFMRDAAVRWKARKPPTILYTILMSNAIPDEAKRLKLRTHVTPVGHTVIQHLMKTHDGLMAAETSGHFFFRDAGGFDDGLHTAARFLHLASRLDRPLSQVRRSIPGYWSTPSFYIHCPDERKAAVMAGVKASLEKGYNTLTLDGVRVELLRSWGLIRPSGTKPELNFRFEGESMADLREAYRVIEREVAKYKLKLPTLESLVVKPLR